jgi:hypothetical protein
MNEKLKELAEQAGFEITPWGNESLPCVHQEGPIDVELEKFAQSIVEECRNVLADVYRQVPLECCGHFLYADEVLAKHFYGVEEQTESQKMAAAGYTRRPRGWTKEGTE